MFLYSLVSIHDVGVAKHSHHLFWQNKKQAGFSLIELVLVMLIIGILSIAAIPKFFDALSFSSGNYFDEVLNSIRYAQKLAVVMGCDVQIATTTNSLALTSRSSCRAGNFTMTIQDPITKGSFVRLAPANVTITSLDMPIYFDRLGRAHNSAGQVVNASLIVANRTITIVAETGFVYEP